MQKLGGAVIPMQLNSESIRYLVGSAEILQNMTKVPVEEPFAEDRIEFLNQISKVLLADRRAKAYPDVITFAFWIRKSNMMRYKTEYISERELRMGRGIVFHIAPSNVAVNYAYSFATGFITGNANIVRLPSKDFKQIDLINEAINKVLEEQEPYSKYRDYMVFLRYGRVKEINDFLSKICDVRVIWGGDATIEELRKSPIGARAGEITFADRYSICVVDAEQYLASSEKDAIALGFYNDTYFMDQNACTSPRIVCWMGKDEIIGQAKTLFWKTLYDLVEKKYDFQAIQSIDKLTEMYLAATQIPGIKLEPIKDWLITRMQVDHLDLKLQEFRGHSGFFYEYETEQIMDLKDLCNLKVQTVSYFGDKRMLYPLLQSGIKGIDRISEIGKTMDFDLTWDGYNLVERMSRVISGIR